MLKAFQNSPLAVSPDNERRGYFACVEASKDDKTSQTVPAQPAVKVLRDSDVEEWSWQKGSFASDKVIPHQQRNKPASSCRIRILFAQPVSTFRHAIPERLAHGTVLQALGLPSHTYSSLQLDSGIYSSHCLPEGSTIATCTSLSFVFRTPQLKDCSIGGLSVSHNFSTGLTTALILGYAFDLKELHANPAFTPAVLGQFVQQLMDCRECWGHPLLLPCLFLVEHARRVQYYVMGSLARRVVRVEHSIGVTTTGRSGRAEYDFPADHQHANDQILFVKGHMQRQNAKALVGTINDLSTTIIFAQRSPQWDIATVQFLSKALEQKRIQAFSDVSNNMFRETLDYLRTYCESSSELVRSSMARVELQLNILYTAIAQDDGQTGARLAASSARDSTSMKIIALITAAYLPGTFVATLFSMGMFNWETAAVTSTFYVYWVVSIPLTIITIGGWAWWWKIEKKQFERDVQQAVTNEQPMGPGERKWKGRWS